MQEHNDCAEIYTFYVWLYIVTTLLTAVFWHRSIHTKQPVITLSLSSPYGFIVAMIISTEVALGQTIVCFITHVAVTKKMCLMKFYNNEIIKIIMPSLYNDGSVVK